MNNFLFHDGYIDKSWHFLNNRKNFINEHDNF